MRQRAKVTLSSDAVRGPWVHGDPIVVFGDDWGRSVSTMQHLFRHIALDHPVIWVNAIGHRPPSLTLADARRAWEKVRAMARPRDMKGSGLSGGGVPLAVIEPRVLPWHNVRPIHALNTYALLRVLRSNLNRQGLTRSPALVTGSPPSVGVVGRLGEAASVYLCMDDFLNFPGVSARMIRPLEGRLLQKVDGVVATAKSLTVSKRPASGRAYHLPQGVNYEHFSIPRPEPADLAPIPHPRIGFAGTLGEACDLALLRRVAEVFDRCSVVLVGMITAKQADIEKLKRPNIHFLGARPYGDLPAYVQAFDVGIIPYVLSDYTKAVDPLKLLEYLAAGLPVVASAIPEAQKYADHIAVAGNADAFVEAVGVALRVNRASVREQGQAVARQNTWERRSDELIGIIVELARRRAAGSLLSSAQGPSGTSGNPALAV